MLLSTLKPLKPKGMSNTPLLRPFPPLYAPFYCFVGLDWTNILKLKLKAFQNAIILAYICFGTSGILDDVKHPHFYPFYAPFTPLLHPFFALGDLIEQLS